ncbi:hypothetical protein SISSUDRAFT_1067999 [Sistotremastrum suecicum HHB10207 ss-3]|uniref:Uncharacterized protein n=1 Tax=Sistotremastrum suecicum HHB10207 ss-3 TaxID=1314776 RepID=A0A165WI62_9AGAM|nr:hypothetical protein SISSUDRAFT_1067999 [Sistotremastrum suecicum HHB10207 ss-3]
MNTRSTPRPAILRIFFACFSPEATASARRYQVDSDNLMSLHSIVIQTVCRPKPSKTPSQFYHHELRLPTGGWICQFSSLDVFYLQNSASSYIGATCTKLPAKSLSESQSWRRVNDGGHNPSWDPNIVRTKLDNATLRVDFCGGDLGPAMLLLHGVLSGNVPCNPVDG